MGRSRSCVRISFLHFERSEKFVEAVAYLTAFYYLLEANGIGNYVCDVSHVDLFNNDGYRYQKQECNVVNFPVLYLDAGCIDKSGDVKQPSQECTNLQQLAQECGYHTGKSSPITPIALVAILLGVSIAVLLILLYFAAEPESEEQKLEKRYWSKQGCKNYAFQKLKMIRLFACVVQLIVQIMARVYYKAWSDRQYCKMPSITTQTGLLYLWPLAIVATAFSAYPLGTPLGSPLHFRCMEGKDWKDTAEEEADAAAAMDALKTAQMISAPWKRATYQMTEMNGNSGGTTAQRRSSSSSSSSKDANGDV
jgi:hypothetical protein